MTAPLQTCKFYPDTGAFALDDGPAEGFEQRLDVGEDD